jgi:hypothetical protein
MRPSRLNKNRIQTLWTISRRMVIDLTIWPETYLSGAGIGMLNCMKEAQIRADRHRGAAGFYEVALGTAAPPVRGALLASQTVHRLPRRISGFVA